eukprot:scaffold45105_cov67-Phaeocystis_antarctica.AAC.3
MIAFQEASRCLPELAGFGEEYSHISSVHWFITQSESGVFAALLARDARGAHHTRVRAPPRAPPCGARPHFRVSKNVTP